MVLGCSYSAMYYHPDPRWSYTWLLKEALGAENLFNMAFGGNSPNGCTRILDWYLRNPIQGMPDFIYVQVPQGQREEYYVAGEEWKDLNEVTYAHTNECMFKLKDTISSTGMPNVRDDESFKDYVKFRRTGDVKYKSNQELVDDVPYHQLKIIGGTLWNQKTSFNKDWLKNFLKTEYEEAFFMNGRDIINVNASWADNRTRDNSMFRKTAKNFHKLWVSHKKPFDQVLNTTRREIATMQGIANRYNIPIVFNSTDNTYPDGVDGFETFCDEKTHYDCLINWDNYIKYQSIAVLSKTYADDPYYDSHPGRNSHENYFNAIWPQIESLLS